MNRPITSPCSAVLTSSPTITLIPSALAARLERARDLVVVGDRDRAEAAGPRLGQQHLDRRRAVVGVVGVHVQVDVDQRRVARARVRSAGVAARVVAAGDEPVVDLLELVGHARPAKLRAQRLGAVRAAARAARGSVDQRASGGRPASATSPGSNSKPVLALGRAAPRRPAAARRPAPTPAAERAHEHARRRPRRPRRRARRTSAPASASASRARSASTNRTRSRSARPSVAGAASGRGDQTVARQSASGGQRPQRAQEQSAAPPRSSSAMSTSSHGRRCAPALGDRVGARERSPGSRRGSSAAAGRAWRW